MALLIAAALFLAGASAPGWIDQPKLVAASNMLIEADLLYITRDEDAHFAHCGTLLDAIERNHPEARAEVLWRRARMEKWSGDEAKTNDEKLRYYERAEALAKQAIEADGKCAECHFWLGVAYGKIGQTRGVLQSLFLVRPILDEMDTVLALDPKHSGAHHVRGVVYRLVPWFAGGSMEKSIEELQLAIQLNAASTISYVELAKSYAEIGDKAKGLATLDALDQVTAPFDPTQAKQDHQHAAELRQELTRS